MSSHTNHNSLWCLSVSTTNFCFHSIWLKTCSYVLSSTHISDAIRQIANQTKGVHFESSSIPQDNLVWTQKAEYHSSEAGQKEHTSVEVRQVANLWFFKSALVIETFHIRIHPSCPAQLRAMQSHPSQQACHFQTVQQTAGTHKKHQLLFWIQVLAKPADQRLCLS